MKREKNLFVRCEKSLFVGREKNLFERWKDLLEDIERGFFVKINGIRGS